MPSDTSPSPTDEAVAAVLAQHPELKGKSGNVLDKWLNRDIEAILSRLDQGIPELHRRMDALLERAAPPRR